MRTFIVKVHEEKDTKGDLENAFREVLIEPWQDSVKFEVQEVRSHEIRTRDNATMEPIKRGTVAQYQVERAPAERY